MASENDGSIDNKGILVEKKNVEEEPALEFKKEEPDSENSEKMLIENTDTSVKLAEQEYPSANKVETKSLKTMKGSSPSDSAYLKKSKTAKERSNAKQGGTFSRSARFLSHSASFTSTRARADGVKKNVDGFSKNDVKNVPANDVKSKTKLLSRNVSAKKTSFSPVPATETSSKNAAVGPSSELPKSANGSSQVGKTATPIKDNEDTRSTTSSNSTTRGRRSSTGSGFSFKLDERAQKRKEFLSKLEEKIQAKEAEKSNLQAKSKENQDAEIKKLRKSLTFKAAPMPSFYKEPPLKTELKKIPTTRPLSPKLGRRKSITEPKKDSIGGDSASGSNSRVNWKKTSLPKETNQAKDLKASKEPMPKSQPKLQTKASSATTKTETKPIKQKPKETEISVQSQKVTAEEPKEQLNAALNISEQGLVGPESNSDENHGKSSVISGPETIPSQIRVGG